MIYILIILLLFASELLYFRIATKYKIVDIPNHRSSHTHTTIRGGGIIYWVAALLYLIFFYSDRSLLFFIGISLIAAVSFIDDIRGVNQKYRLIAHLSAITVAFVLSNLFSHYPWWVIIGSYFILIGIVNAYNFMDGINGITGLYSVAVLLSLQYVNLYQFHFTTSESIWFPLIASFVFLFFNFRKKAICFAGDIGSISIAFWVVTLLLLLIVKTGNLIWIGFLAVYGIDSVMTILHRLYLKQNIFEPHRMHFYQVLVNEQKQSHLLVSTLYFIVQMIASVAIIFLYPIIGWWIIVIILFLLIGVYLLKFKAELKERRMTDDR